MRSCILDEEELEAGGVVVVMAIAARRVGV